MFLCVHFGTIYKFGKKTKEMLSYYSSSSYYYYYYYYYYSNFFTSDLVLVQCWPASQTVANTELQFRKMPDICLKLTFVNFTLVKYAYQNHSDKNTDTGFLMERSHIYHNLKHRINHYLTFFSLVIIHTDMADTW